jgi:hypothetical protein
MELLENSRREFIQRDSPCCVYAPGLLTFPQNLEWAPAIPRHYLKGPWLLHTCVLRAAFLCVPLHPLCLLSWLHTEDSAELFCTRHLGADPKPSSGRTEKLRLFMAEGQLGDMCFYTASHLIRDASKIIKSTTLNAADDLLESAQD